MSLLVALLVLAGALFAFIGSLGLVRLGTFFERAHPPTMGTTLGTSAMMPCGVLVSAICAIWRSLITWVSKGLCQCS